MTAMIEQRIADGMVADRDLQRVVEHADGERADDLAEQARAEQQDGDGEGAHADAATSMVAA